MKRKIIYQMLAACCIIVLLTSFKKKISSPFIHTKKITSSTNLAPEVLLLVISQTTNLGMPKVEIYSDTIYSSYAFNDGLFKSLPMGYEDKITSFHLPKGYMVVFAENSDGTGESACFVAVKSDVNANLPKRLCNNISFIRFTAINNPDKKGAAHIKDAPINVLGSQWYYGWSLNRNTFPNQQFVPMTWGKGTAADDKVKYLINRKDVDHLLSFNEPDNKTQSNMPDFDTAVARYKIMQKTGLRLGSPATTQGHAFGEGKWLTQFMEKATKEKARVDYIALHWYDWGNQTNNKTTDQLTAESVFMRFTKYLERVHDTYPDKPLWITEFNANVNRTSEPVQIAFMKLAVEWMDNQNYIERYAYFFPRVFPEVNADNTLTEIGKYWKSITSRKAFIDNITGDAIIIKAKQLK